MSTEPSFGRDLALLRARIAELEAAVQQERARLWLLLRHIEPLLEMLWKGEPVQEADRRAARGLWERLADAIDTVASHPPPTPVRACSIHGPIPGLRYCPECASSGKPWTEAQADAAHPPPTPEDR